MKTISEKQAFSLRVTIKRLEESTRDSVAIGIWLVVYIGLLYLTAHGQSKLMTTGLMFLLAGTYSTFLLCAKQKYAPFINAVPYVLVFTGTIALCLAPDFRHPVLASFAFFSLTALMHGFVIYGMRKKAPEMDTGMDTIADCAAQHPELIA
jgi:hypothetical protein